MSELLPEGKYRARPMAWALGVSTQKATPQAEVVFELLDEEHQGKTRTWTGSFAEGKATEITFKGLQACGLQGVDLSVLETQPPPDVEVVLVIEHEIAKDGKTYEKVRWVNKPFSGLRTSPMEAGSKAAFIARMKGVLAGLDREQASKKMEAPPSDDIPF